MKNNKGFTLIEIMITLLISGVIVAAIYSSYMSQQRIYHTQEQVVEMQQNIRAALMTLTRDIRMAGYDPERAGGIGFVAINTGRVRFTQDITNDTGTGSPDGDTADPGEMIDFGFSVANDNDNNGLPDTVNVGVPVALSLGKQTNGGGYQGIAENIQAIEFRYLDTSNNVTTVLEDIRSVQISILARASKPDRNFTNTITYTPASGTPWDLNTITAGNAPDDNFRRRLLITTVNCRNMGL